MKKLIITAILTVAGGAAFAQIDTNDASLRLWLKADTLSGTNVSLWADSSASGIRLVVPFLPEPAAYDDPTNHTPRLVSVTNAAKVFKAVQIRGVTDRLWQTNSLGAGDPTAIAPSEDLTIFLAFHNFNTTTSLNPWGTIVAKRSSDESPYMVFFSPASAPLGGINENMFFSGTYARSGLTSVPAEWGVVEFTAAADSTLTARDFYGSLGGWRENVGTTSRSFGDGTSAISYEFWSADGTPFTVGFSTYNGGLSTSNAPFGNGGGEVFSGNIAEVILFNRSLSSTERDGVEKYLVDKYIVNTNGPVLVSATRDLLSSNKVTVVFAESVSVPTATVAGNYSINNGVSVTNASAVIGSRTVVLTTSALGLGTSYTLTVNNVQNVGGYTIPVNSQIPVVVPAVPPRVQSSGPDGLLVLEAEHFDANVSAGGISWVFSDVTIGFGGETTAFSGEGAMVTTPNTGVNLGNSFGAAPHLDFLARFLTAGTNYLWLRGLGDSNPGPTANDSVFVGLDGNVVINGGRFSGVFPQGSGYFWSKTSATPPALLVVPNAGDHVVSVWMREDGFIVDKLLTTTNSSYTPSGIGPDESPRAPGVSRLITVGRSGGDLLISWDSGILQSATQITGPWADVSGATSPLTVTPSGPATFYRTR